MVSFLSTHPETFVIKVTHYAGHVFGNIAISACMNVAGSFPSPQTHKPCSCSSMGEPGNEAKITLADMAHESLCRTENASCANFGIRPKLADMAQVTL